MEVLPKLVAEYLEVRDATNTATKRRNALRERIMELLDEVGGSYVDEASGMKLTITQTPRWEYDATALHKLVKDGLIRGEELADALETVVNKDKVQKWVDDGLVTDRQLTRAGARRMTKAVEVLTVKPVGRGVRPT